MDKLLVNQARLMIVIVNGNEGRTIVNAIRQAGAPGCTKIAGDGFNVLAKRSKVAWTEQDILFSLIGGDVEHIIDAINRSTAKNRISATVMLVDAIDVNAVTTKNKSIAANAEAAMEGTMQLIITIASHGLTDEIMRAARQAGAKGGTVLNARGTGTEEDTKFFGVSLAPEKEMLLILVENEQAPQILDAINSQPALREPGAGIVFTIDVAQSFFFNNSR